VAYKGTLLSSEKKRTGDILNRTDESQKNVEEKPDPTLYTV